MTKSWMELVLRRKKRTERAELPQPSATSIHYPAGRLGAQTQKLELPLAWSLGRGRDLGLRLVATEESEGATIPKLGVAPSSE